MNCLKSSVKLKLLWQFHSVMPPPLSLSQSALTRYFTLSLTIALFFATHSARVLSVRNIDSSLFLSLSLFLCVWFQVILNKDFANLENLVWTSKRVFCCYIFSPKETAQNSKPALACSTHTHKLTRTAASTRLRCDSWDVDCGQRCNCSEQEVKGVSQVKGKEQQQQHLVKTAQQQQLQCQCSSTGNTSNKYTQNSRVEKIYICMFIIPLRFVSLHWAAAAEQLLVLMVITIATRLWPVVQRLWDIKRILRWLN